MKKNIVLGLFSLLSLHASAQLNVTPNATAQNLVNKLVTNSGTAGVVVSNAALKCDSNSNALLTGNSLLGVSDGIVLCTGKAASDPNALYAGLNAPYNWTASNANLVSLSDTDLVNLVSGGNPVIHDACVLEFDMQPVGNYVEFEYVFGSEEYPEFICSVFNDVFGFFISGPGITGNKNIAVLPNSSTFVSINNVNDGSSVSCGQNNTSYYITGNDTNAVLDGFTVPLIATTTVTPGATYHLKLAIGDNSDQVLDSYVILTANSLKSGNTNQPESITQFTKDNGLLMSPTLFDDQLSFENLSAENWQVNIIDINGRIMHQQILRQGKDNVSTANYSAGLYVVKATNLSSHKTITQKINKL